MINDLRKLVIAQKTAVLPAEAPFPDLQALHQAILDYDQLVSQVVIQVIQEIPFAFPGERAGQLREQAEKQLAEAGDRREVEIYRRYKQRLDQMRELVENYPSSAQSRDTK